MPFNPQRALIAAANWGEPLAPPRLISARENLVFEVSYKSGLKAALRLHRPNYQDEASILSELQLAQALAQKRLPVPTPLPTLDGALLAQAGDRLASLISWCEGMPFGRAEAKLPNAPQQMYELGQLIARLHEACDQLSLPKSFTRHRWDQNGFLGEAPNWGRFWESPALTLAERDELLTFRASAAAALAAVKDFCLIHADLLRENILRTDAGLTLIDFDDAGFGYRCFDLATALVQSLEDADLTDQIGALLSGYGAARPLADSIRRDLTLFLCLRLAASTGWLISRAPPDDPGHRIRVRRALRLIRLWQAGEQI